MSRIQCRGGARGAHPRRLIRAALALVALGVAGCAAAPGAYAPRPTPAPAPAQEQPAAPPPLPTLTAETQRPRSTSPAPAEPTSTEGAAGAPVPVTTEGTALPPDAQTRVPPTPTAAATRAPSATPLPPPTPPQLPTQAPTQLPTPAATLTAIPPVAPVATPTPALPTLEDRVVELEWPAHMRLGESDVIRLSFIPSQAGYTVTVDFPEHQVVTRTVAVARPPDYDLFAIARLDLVGFDLAPAGEQAQELAAGEPAVWRWSLTPRSTGQHRLAITLRLRWTPRPGAAGLPRERVVYSRALDIQVSAFLGLTPTQATSAGLAGLLCGGGLSAFAVLYRRRARPWRNAAPNRALAIEPLPGMTFSPAEDVLLRTMFRQYSRIVAQHEFRSGYSGARTLLVLPIHADGRADAHTIAKLGEREAIQREFDNYEQFVKNRLPPITARIQEPPALAPNTPLAALRYTFIGEPGHTPTSLREALLSNPDPALLSRLFETFGPHWWLQRRPCTFRLAQEYDRALPAHLVIEPVSRPRGADKPRAISGRAAPTEVEPVIGELVRLRDFARVERRPDGRSCGLIGYARPGQPPLRVRWLGPALNETLTGRVVATRDTLLRGFVAGMDLFGLPDPLERVPAWLAESVAGSQSTIHGDLNLENVLIGPGGLVWLIDFAQTREGHTLQDFAHLESEIVAHVLAAQTDDPAAYLRRLQTDGYPLLDAVREMAARCLFNPARRREYHLAQIMACLGALKYENLNPHQKHCLYLTAAQCQLTIED